VADAAAVLRPGGRLYLVANRFLPYETALRMQYRRVTVLFADRQYKVLLGEK
jgi:16S rRNA (guanine1207-N2)-methyltransferase